MISHITDAIRGSRGGMTLLELMVALTLATLLGVAVLGIVSGVTRQYQVLLKQTTGSDWHDNLEQQLSWELAHADSISVSTDRLKIRGLLSKHAKSRIPTHQEAVVTYELRSTKSGTWLLKNVMETPNSSTPWALVAADVTQLSAYAGGVMLPKDGQWQTATGQLKVIVNTPARTITATR